MKLILAFYLSTLSYSAEMTFWAKMPSTRVGTCRTDVIISIPNEPKAVALLLHGSGAMNKDGTFPGGYTIYKDIAEDLFKNDIVTIRFDKRNSIEECVKNVNSPRFSYKQFIEDAQYITEESLKKIKFMGKEFPLYIVGHSQGSDFAFTLANILNAKGVVSLAGLGKYAIDETVLRQLSAQLKAPGLTEAQRKQIQSLITKGSAYFKKVRSGKAKPNEKFFGAYASFWGEYISYTANSAQNASKLTIPTLVIRGSLDNNITKDDYDALVVATEKVKGSSAKHFEGITHILTEGTNKKVSKKVTNFMSQWINNGSR